MMKKLIYTIMVFAAMVFIYGCEGPEGDAGPQGLKGSDGATGQTGVEGEDGEDGKDGISLFNYDESISTGSIKVEIEGTLPGDVDLNESLEFPYNLQFRSLEDNSAAYQYEAGFGFEIYRTSNMNTINFRMVSRDGVYLSFEEEYGEFYFYDAYFEGIVLTDDFKSYVLDLNNMAGYINEVTDYYYDSTTGVLKLTAHALIPGAENVTGNDLTVTIYVDVIVFNSGKYGRP